jgi:cephalosporin-C deacetylase-like acetyl esterase
MRRALLLASLILLAGCGGAGNEPPAAKPAPRSTLPANLLHLYDYDASAPFDKTESGVQDKDGGTVHDVTYAGPKGRISAFLVLPDGDGPFPAVRFVPGAPGARYPFFTESLELARRGIASLLPDPPYTRPPIEDVVNFTPEDRDGIVQEVTEMRRGIDLLVSCKDIDPNRLGYVGFSWGGSLGAIFAAVERRVGSFVLMSAIPHLSADMRRLGEERGETDLAAYEEVMEPIDAVNYLPHVAPNAVFLQFGSQDTRPSPADGHEAADATSKPKEAKWYDAEHELNDQARADRESWLAERLGVS